jgi:hypothetical protein
MSSKNTKRKIFARNLTARADRVVRGNPANSRPESGVDNCYPGLEFDQRNLEQAFFPGLTFEFQRPDGAIITAIDETTIGKALSDIDSPPSRPLFLWFLYGRTMPDKSEGTLFSFRGQPGSEVWRRVRDLLPERVAILLGPGPAIAGSFQAKDALDTLKVAWKEGRTNIRRAGGPTPARLAGRMAGPWALGGQDLDIWIDGKGPSRITFAGAGFLGATNVRAQIGSGCAGVTAETPEGTGLIVLKSNTSGRLSHLKVDGPAAATLGLSAALGLPAEARGHETSGSIEYAVLVADRAAYLNDDGVIDVEAYPPGQLTKTMCAPWMYDFRDCYCFYWASNKPDVVDVADGSNSAPPRYFNFMRRDRAEHDIDTWEGRRDLELTYTDLVGNRGWEWSLPVVLNDQEVPDPPRAPESPCEDTAC